MKRIVCVPSFQIPISDGGVRDNKRAIGICDGIISLVLALMVTLIVAGTLAQVNTLHNVAHAVSNSNVGISRPTQET